MFRKFIGESSFVALTGYMILALGFAGQIILLTILSPADFGKAAVMLGTIELISTIINLEFSSVANYHMSSED